MRYPDILICAAALFAASPATAGQATFEATLTGSAAAPPSAVAASAVAASGRLKAALDTETRVLFYRATYVGLTGAATAADFCTPAKGGHTGTPVITIADAASPISGHITLTPAQASDLQKGLWCFNVHTAAHPDGEVGGQVKRRVGSANTNAPGAGQNPSDVNRSAFVSLGMQ